MRGRAGAKTRRGLHFKVGRRASISDTAGAAKRGGFPAACPENATKKVATVRARGRAFKVRISRAASLNRAYGTAASSTALGRRQAKTTSTGADRVNGSGLSAFRSCRSGNANLKGRRLNHRRAAKRAVSRGFSRLKATKIRNKSLATFRIRAANLKRANSQNARSFRVRIVSGT